LVFKTADGLNRLELKQLRYEWYDSYAIYRLALSESSISQSLKNRVIQKIEELRSSESPFAGMIRYFEKLNELN
jgi:hypothetical protein